MSEAQAKAPGPMVRTDFSLSLRGGALRGSAEVPAGKTTLTQLLPVIHNLENAIIGKTVEGVNAAGYEISCRAGCGACCRQLVPLSIFEAEAMTDWIRSLPSERQAELAERFHRALSALRDAGVIEKILSNEYVYEGEPMLEMTMAYFYAGVPCPFLENESCSIHPIRPLACREYLVVSPPELCKDPMGNEVTGVQLPVRLTGAMSTFGYELSGDERGWIPLVFLMAWGKNAQRPGDFVTGTGEELLRRFLERAEAVMNANDPDEAEETSA